MRIGLIGRGRWGENIERTLQAMGVTVVIGERGKILEGVDGVCIATPSATHAAVALPYIERSIPTFIEKPLAISVTDAERLRDAALSSGAIVHVGHIHLHNPAFHAVQANLGTIGELQSILFEGMHSMQRTDSSVIWDWLPHDFSMLFAMLPNDLHIDGVHVTKGSPAQHAIVTYTCGSVRCMSVMSAAWPDKRRVVTIEGSGGAITFDDRAEKKVVLNKNGDVQFLEYASELPLRREMQVFIDAITSGGVDIRPLDLALRVVRSITEVERYA